MEGQCLGLWENMSRSTLGIRDNFNCIFIHKAAPPVRLAVLDGQMLRPAPYF